MSTTLANEYGIGTARSRARRRRNPARGRAKAFIDDAYEGTFKHPFMPTDRVVSATPDGQEFIQFRLFPVSEDTVDLMTMFVNVPRKGHAGRFMDALIQKADQHDVKLVLTAKGFGSHKMSPRDLVRFYKKYGFEMKHKGDRPRASGNDMIRLPGGQSFRGAGSGVTKLTLKYNRDYDEYIVKVWRGSKWDEDASYFTDDKEDALDTMESMRHDYGLPPSKARRARNSATFSRDFRRSYDTHGLDYDPDLGTPSMRRHLREIGSKPRKNRQHWSDREWAEFAGFNPNQVKNLAGVSGHGTYPGVRVDRITGRTVHSQQEVEIDGTRKPLYLIWLKGGRKFRLVGTRSSMKELAADFAQLGEPVMLDRVDYIAPRYPVPVGVRRNKDNREMSIAFTHKVENPTELTWNGRRDPAKARFDVSVKAPSRRWVNRSGLIF